MISEGIIKEYKDSSGKGFYGLVKVNNSGMCSINI